MRQTKFIPGYGHVTIDPSCQYGGNVFSKLFDFVTSKPVKDIAIEAGKSFAKTAGTKTGEKLVDKVFKPKESKVIPSVKATETVKPLEPIKPKKSLDQSLREIYGQSLFKKSKR